MTLTLEQVLAHPCLQPASPQLLAGNPARRPVRWVHSSDIYDIAPLLRGGELLLTTGLGLAASDAGQRRAYVRSLAERDVAGVALELSTPFTTVPADMVDEARQLGLPLVALRTVAPFVEVTEQINSAILDSSVLRLRHAEDVGRALSLVVAEGGGLEALTSTLASRVRRPVVVTDAAGGVLCTTADDASRVLAAPAATAGITRDGVLLARLAVGTGTSAEDLVSAAMERAPEIFAIEVLRGRSQALLGGRERRHLLGRLLAGAPDGTTALAAHAARSRVRPDAGWVGVAVAPGSEHAGLALVQDAAREPGVHVLAAELEGTTCALLALPRTGGQEARARVVASLSAAGGPLAAIGPLSTVETAAASLRAARSCLLLGPLTPSGTRVLQSDDLVVERLLSSVPDPVHLSDLVAQQLDGLLRVRGAATLLETLEHYVSSGCSKAATARDLHLRRQSVHARLARASAHLGYDVSDPGRQTPLRLALAARRALEEGSAPDATSTG